MNKLINSEYRFIRKTESVNLSLIVYINYSNKSYDIVQDGQEGIFVRDNNNGTEINIAYMNLAIEALEFIENELSWNQ